MVEGKADWMKQNGRLHKLLPADGEIRAKAHKLCKDYLHGAWLNIQPQEMVLKRVSGGLSNLLYYCSLPEGMEPVEDEPGRLLVRLYGKVNGERAMETLVTESVIFALLSESQRGPRLYGVFPGGRLEEYIQARPLRTDELSDSDYSGDIADKMAQIHLMDVPISKQPKWLWQTMHRWLNDIDDRLNRQNDSDDTCEIIEKLKKLNLSQELVWLKNYLTQVSSPVVFCHNDLQEGNILLRDRSENREAPADNRDTENGGEEDTKSQEEPSTKGLKSDRLVVIDYEYCSYNYRGFDFANHFCERVYDYTNEEPPYFWEKPENAASREQQEKFFERYLSSLKSSKDYRPKKLDTIDNLLEETKAFALGSHMFWALWSLVNSTVSEITFDYWGYGEARFRAYFNHKEKLITESSQDNSTGLQEV